MGCIQDLQRKVKVHGEDMDSLLGIIDKQGKIIDMLKENDDKQDRKREKKRRKEEEKQLKKNKKPRTNCKRGGEEEGLSST